MASEFRLDWKEMADRIEKTDWEAFAWLLGLEFAHDDEAEECKAMVVHALRFADFHDISWPPPKKEDYKPTVTTGLSENGIG